MKTYARYAILVCATSILASCAHEPLVEIPGAESGRIPIRVAGEIDQVYKTRVNDQGFTDGDIIGIYAVNYNEDSTPGTIKDNGNQADNVRHTYVEAENHWVGAYDIYFKDKNTPVDIIGYYPFSSEVKVAAHTIFVHQDQGAEPTNGGMSNYEASDFLWGKVENVAPTSERIMMSFRHVLSGVRITLAEGSGFAEGEWAAAEKLVTIVNTVQNAEIDLSTAAVTPLNAVADRGIIPHKQGSDYRAVVIPQTISAGTPLLSISLNGLPYSYSRSEAMTFVPGRQHNFTMTVNKRADGDYELSLSGESITAWENDGISHEMTSREYLVVTMKEPDTIEKEIAALGKDYRQVKHLKIVGKFGSQPDWFFLRDKMTLLESLNLKEADIQTGLTRDFYYGQVPDPDAVEGEYFPVIPDNALNGKKTLVRVILPDNIKAIGAEAFYECTNLSGSLVIPEGVEAIFMGAFAGCSSLTGTLTLPSTLKILSNQYWDGGTDYYMGCFMDCSFTGDLHIPESVTHIGANCFAGNRYLTGNLNLPEGLVYIGERAFQECRKMKGSLKIPQGVSQIYPGTFSSCGFDGTLSLHDGITFIGNDAFMNVPLKGELILPSGLQTISQGTFSGCNFSGELVLPEGLTSIGDNAFNWNWRLNGVIDIPDGVTSIGSYAFANCRNIQGFTFGKGLQVIKEGAFCEDYGIGKLVCHSSVPPFIQERVFDGVAKDNFTLEVPESSIAVYQTQEGWRDFKRISAYANLVVRPMMANAINTQTTRELILNADDEWEVASKPEWISLSPDSGNGKTEIALTFEQMTRGADTREGDVVFRLKGTEYTTKCHVSQYDYEYDEDQEIILQTHSKGGGVNLVILGDGYDASEVSSGQYLRDMEQIAEYFFSVEPYTTYRDYFNVSTAIAVSPESGIGGINTIVHNKFNTTSKGDVNVSARAMDYDAIYDYADEHCEAVTAANRNNATIIMMANCEDYAGIAFMNLFAPNLAYVTKFDDGTYDGWRGVVNHEAGGHAFGLLGDEYIYHNRFIDNCDCNCCGHEEELSVAFSYGWFKNLSLTSDMDRVPWSHLIFHPKYSQQVDIFEGGYMHSRDVFRSEQNSCMNNNVPYYSAISREQIVKRIMSLAGEQYSFEDFVAKDKTTASVATRAAMPFSSNAEPAMHHRPVLNFGDKVYGLDEKGVSHKH